MTKHRPSKFLSLERFVHPPVCIFYGMAQLESANCKHYILLSLRNDAIGLFLGVLVVTRWGRGTQYKNDRSAKICFPESDPLIAPYCALFRNILKRMDQSTNYKRKNKHQKEQQRQLKSIISTPTITVYDKTFSHIYLTYIIH